ncbi:hypothetical protein [Aminobacterium mobile]|jgi:hypothetical protein
MQNNRPLIGKWNNKWVIGELEKAICYLTGYGDYDKSLLRSGTPKHRQIFHAVHEEEYRSSQVP